MEPGTKPIGEEAGKVALSTEVCGVLGAGALPCPESLSLQAARRYCTRLALNHYENFPVVSWLLPRSLRQHFCNVYAFCRWADDLADETGDAARALQLLDWWEHELDACYAGKPRHPVFIALRETIQQFELPDTLFRALLQAFRQDQIVTEYETYEQLLGYCRQSANPVGRLVLHMCGYRDEERQALSDCICTGLQLTNFWQDVTVDFAKGRIYLPREDRIRFGVSTDQIARREFSVGFSELMRFEVGRTREWFAQGARLAELVKGSVRRPILLFSRGGEEVLRLIEKSGYDVLAARPKLSRSRKAALIAGAIWGGGRGARAT